MSAAVMTEPERRRAAGEAPFEHERPYQNLAATFLRDVAEGRWSASFAKPQHFACQMVAAQLRAIVQQTLVDRIVAWCEEVAT